MSEELEKADKLTKILRRVWQPTFFGFMFFTSREGYLSNPASPLIPGGGPPPPPNTCSVSFSVTRGTAPYTGTGFVTVNGINHVTTGTGIYTTTYAYGAVLQVNFTGLGITCTPTAVQSITVPASPTADVPIIIPC